MDFDAVNLNEIPNIISTEDPYVLSLITVTHNDAHHEDLDVDNGVLGVDHTVDHDEPNLSTMPGPSSSTQEPMAPEIIDISWVNETVASQWVPQQSSGAESVDLVVGAQYANKDDLISAVKMFHLNAHAEYKVTHSNFTRLILKCKLAHNGCTWRLRASIPLGSSYFRIAVHQSPHTCFNSIGNRDHVQLNSAFVAHCIKDVARAQLSITSKAIIAMIKEQYNFTISYKKAWLAKQHAMVLLFGDWEESYKILLAFMAEMQKANLGSVVVWNSEATSSPGVEKFKLVFWAFDPSFEGLGIVDL
ncbi:hypothetical protein MRB53_026582 [Persea americana]|uniref:Uncharacterized protein n=1 Tax=Persea americana TaxID=3435 RepID=A0ACC2LJ44_PERAE|nr:hypothetical protein MRB53_026582 [Persea americana]